MRYWLIEFPEIALSVVLRWYRLYFLVMLVIAAVVPTSIGLISLCLYLFGIRWGW